MFVTGLGKLMHKAQKEPPPQQQPPPNQISWCCHVLMFGLISKRESQENNISGKVFSVI